MTFHPGWRDLAISRARDSAREPLDLVVVGGGISGCGVALDAAQRGLRVLLVERDDVASGTSSRSSKLVHGGLRYLKEMQFRVTRQACRERDRMLQLSPHLVKPLRFVYPASHGDKMPAWTVDAGLWMYDRLTRSPDKHRTLAAAEVEALVPGLATEDLETAFVYGDALADDARLTLAVAASAFAYGAALLTRAELVGGVRDAAGRVAGVEVRDLESGEVIRVAATVVLNATGAWVDAVRERFGLPGRRVRPSRGSHLIVARERLPIAAAVTVPAADDGRPVFLIPHPEGVLVGTTDLFHDGPLDDPRPSAAEVSYLFRTLEVHFPGARLGPGDVRGAFAGLRPILMSEAENPSEVSREEAIWEEQGLVSVAGGKLTTWRSTAEEVVDALVKRLSPRRRRKIAPCRTKGTPLSGLAPADLDAQLAAATPGLVDAGVATAMARRLGDLAWNAVALARDPRELRPLADGVDLTAAEVRAHLRHGAVVRLEDLLLRRVRLGMWQPETVAGVVPALEPVLRAERGWDAARWERERDGLAAALAGWSPLPASASPVPAAANPPTA